MLQGYSSNVFFRWLGNLEVLLLAIHTACIVHKLMKTGLALELENNYSKMHLEIDLINSSIHQSKSTNLSARAFCTKFESQFVRILLLDL